MKLKFGVNLRREKTGAEWYVVLLQAVSLLPAFYIVMASGYPYIMTEKSVLGALSNFGVSALPRAAALAVSLLYRKTGGEIVTCLALLAAALAFGLVMGGLLKGNYRTARASRVALVALIAGDLILRLLPLQCNRLFGAPVEIPAFLFRLVCLALVALDLRADRADAKETPPKP